MYTWKLEYLMKNGQRVKAMYKGPENNTDAVLKKLYTAEMTALIPTYGENDQEIVAVMMGEIAAIRIYQ